MRQKGSFWNWYKMIGIMKALNCMFEIVKKCKISLPVHDQVSGERYRTIGPLVYICDVGLCSSDSKFQTSKAHLSFNKS